MKRYTQCPAQCNHTSRRAEVAVIRCKWPLSPPPAPLLPSHVESNRSKSVHGCAEPVVVDNKDLKY